MNNAARFTWSRRILWTLMTLILAIIIVRSLRYGDWLLVSTSLTLAGIEIWLHRQDKDILNNRDRMWCVALIDSVATDAIEAVTTRFNELREGGRIGFKASEFGGGVLRDRERTRKNSPA